MLLVIFLKDLYHKESQISRFIMEIKNGIIIDGVLHEMSKRSMKISIAVNVHCVKNAKSVRWSMNHTCVM